MRLDADQTLEVLAAKGVDSLYHANTVRTACSFLLHGAMLSRGYASSRQMRQTPQPSDEQDRQFGVWNALFFDCVDIHRQLSRRNAYGPVLFVFPLANLQLLRLDWLWVTKRNPMYWKDGESDADHWFQSVDELRDGFRKGNFDQMLVFKEDDGYLEMYGSLQSIILDDPGLMIDGKPVFDLANETLQNVMHQAGFPYRVDRRQCKVGCECRQKYAAMYKQTLLEKFGA